MAIGLAAVREVIFSPEFDQAAEALGGYWIIDRALETVYDGLIKNPYGFHKFESDLFSFRYAITSRIEDIPPLVFIFVIDGNKDVVLQHVEEYASY